MYYFLSILLLAHSAIINADEITITAVNEAPANFIDENGNATGISVDIVKAMQKIVGSNIRVAFMPEARAVNSVRNKKNNMLLSISRTPYREPHYHWIGPVIKKSWVLYTKDPKKSFTSVDDLKQLKSIGVVRGDIREQWLVNQSFTNLHSVTRHEQNVRMLLKGRVDAIVYEQFGLIYLAQKSNLDLTMLKPAFVLRQSDVYIVLSKNTPLEEVDKWRSAYRQIKNNGELDAINIKWHHYLKDKYQAEVSFFEHLLVL